MSTVENTGYARVFYSRQWSNYSVIRRRRQHGSVEVSISHFTAKSVQKLRRLFVKIFLPVIVHLFI